MTILARFKWPIIIALSGAAMMIPVIASFIGLFRDSGTQFFVPSETSINIVKPGDYTLWHEAKTMIEGQIVSFPDSLPTGTTIKVLRQPEGTPVTMRQKGSSHMEKNGIRRIAVGQLTFRQPGEYRVIVTGLPERRAFYLERSKWVKTIATIVICGFGGMLCFFSAVGFATYSVVQLVHDRKGAKTPPGPYPPATPQS
jgi:hypothetical protein